VAEWLIAIRQAAAKAGGFAPGSASGPGEASAGTAAQTEEIEIVPRFSGEAVGNAVCIALFFVFLNVFFIAFQHHLADGRATVWNFFFAVGMCGMIVFTTLGGWTAVSQIRRSGGRLHGLWLAVFDGLFFPLLVADAVIFALTYLLVTLLAKLPYFSVAADGDFGGGLATGYQIAMRSFIWLGSGTIFSLVADLLVIRRVWRAVNQDSAGVPRPDSGGRRRKEAQTEKTASEERKAESEPTAPKTHPVVSSNQPPWMERDWWFRPQPALRLLVIIALVIFFLPFGLKLLRLPPVMLVFIFGLVAGILVLLIRRVWRTANKDSAGVPPPDSSRRRGDEAQTEKPVAGEDKSQSLRTPAATSEGGRFSRMAIVVAVLVAIIGATAAVFGIKSHYATPAVILSESEFLDKFASNQIAHAVINLGGGQAASVLSPVTGTFYAVDKDGKITKEEIQFICPKAYFTSNMLDRLLRSGKITVGKPQGVRMNLVWSVVPFIVLGLVGFLVILLIPGIIIYAIWRAVKTNRGHSVPPQIQKPDRFWRWFAVAVFAMIAIPFLISIFGLLAAIAIPNFVKAREQSRENAQQATQKLSSGPGAQVSATAARTGDVEVWLQAQGTVASSNSVFFQIAEDDCQEVIRKFDAHQALPVEAFDRQGKKFGQGFLIGVDNEIDTTTGMLKCRASLIPEGENLMVPSLFLNLRMVLEVKHGVTLVPAAVVQHDAESAYVWVIQPDHTVTHRLVRCGAQDENGVEIQSGLSPGEIVVSGGLNGLQEGQKVSYKLVQQTVDRSVSDTAGPKELKSIPPEAEVLWAAMKADTKSFLSKDDNKDTNAMMQFEKEMDARNLEFVKLLQGTIAEPLVNLQEERMRAMGEQASQHQGNVDQNLCDQLDATGKELEALILAAAPAATNALLAEPPKLQFLAWQDEWQTNQPGAARHPDGSPVTEENENGWLRHISSGGVDVSSLHLSPEPRFLKLWFSHPLFDRTSLNEIVLYYDTGKAIGFGANDSVCEAAEPANDLNGQLGWQVKTVSPDAGTNLPSRIEVLLFYTAGPLERTNSVLVTPNSSTVMSLEGGSQLNGMGQNVDGKTFVSIAVDANKLRGREFGALAVTKDGRELTASGDSVGGSTDRTGVMVKSFVFDAPLADVASFIIGTRPIRTMEWKDVVLPAN
jgi:hypothetical protein